MAKQISAIEFVGSVGNVTGSKGLDGKTIIRRKVDKISNPQTDAQMAQRAKMKLAAKVAALLGVVGKTALVANGFKATRRGKLNKQLLEKMYVEDNTAKLPRVLTLVNNGVQVPVAEEATVTCTLNGSTFTAGFGAGFPAGIYSAKALLIYNRVTGEWISQSVLDTARTIEIFVEDAANCDAYFYAQIVVPTTAAAAAKLNNLIAGTPGYNVVIDRMDSSSYKYSKTFNAGIVDGTAYSDRVPANVTYGIAQMANILYEAMRTSIDLGMANIARDNGTSTEVAFLNVNEAHLAPKMQDVQWDKLQLTKGTLTEVALGEANFTTPLQVTVPIDDPYSDPRFNNENDKVYLVVLSKTSGMAVLSEGVKRTEESITVSVPGYWQGHYVEVFAYVVGTTGTVSEGQVSPTIYCGSGRIA